MSAWLLPSPRRCERWRRLSVRLPCVWFVRTRAFSLFRCCPYPFCPFSSSASNQVCVTVVTLSSEFLDGSGVCLPALLCWASVRSAPRPTARLADPSRLTRACRPRSAASRTSPGAELCRWAPVQLLLADPTERLRRPPRAGPASGCGAPTQAGRPGHWGRAERSKCSLGKIAPGVFKGTVQRLLWFLETRSGPGQVAQLVRACPDARRSRV